MGVELQSSACAPPAEVRLVGLGSTGSMPLAMLPRQCMAAAAGGTGGGFSAVAVTLLRLRLLVTPVVLGILDGGR